MRHLVDANRGGEDQEIILSRPDLHSVGVPHAEPLLRDVADLGPEIQNVPTTPEEGSTWFPDEGLDLERYIEKPEYHYSVSMGINILEPVALGMIASGESLGMPDLMLRLKAAGHRVATYEAPCRWLDIGRVDDYAKAQEEFAANAEIFLGAGA